MPIPDVVIRNGTVFDGTGREGRSTDLIIEGGQIRDLATFDGEAATEIDATGLYVTPGFIDIHSHADYTLLVDPRAVSSVYQGVTLEVVGNCGFGCFPLYDPAESVNAIYGYNGLVAPEWKTADSYLESLEAARPAVNVMTLVPNGQLRMAVIGLSDREATDEEIVVMGRLLDQFLEEGAWGFSSGLEYAAESSASDHEITELCKHVARVGGLYATHTRARDEGAAIAVTEAVQTARAADVRLQISHLFPRNGPDESERCLEIVDHAWDSGMNLAFDMHTRLYGTTYLYTVLPPWALRGGPEDIRTRLASPSERLRMKSYRSILSASGNWGRVILLDNPVWPEYGQRNLAEIANERGQEPLDAIYDILAREPDQLSSMMTISHVYSEDEQERFFTHPLCVPASDATTLAPDGPFSDTTFHGSYTWAAWYWRFMVQDRAALSPAEAVFRLTGYPAKILQLKGRGLLQRGMSADVAVFAPERFREMGTTFRPNELAEGMVHVFVDGVPVLFDGTLTNERPGRVLRR